GATLANLDRERFGRMEHVEGGAHFSTEADFESLIGGDEYPRDAKTASDGSFEIKGLQPRSYRLRVNDGATLAMLVTDPIAAGSRAIEIRLPDEPRRALVAGVVVSSDGAPVAGAFVHLVRELEGDERRREIDSEPVRTDDQGRFEIRNA